MPEIHRIRRLRERIGADPAPFSPLPTRPRNQKRFWRAVARIAIEEASLIRHLAGISADLSRRARVRGWSRPI
jgi:hypothetical protein